MVPTIVQGNFERYICKSLFTSPCRGGCGHTRRPHRGKVRHFYPIMLKKSTWLVSGNEPRAPTLRSLSKMDWATPEAC